MKKFALVMLLGILISILLAVPVWADVPVTGIEFYVDNIVLNSTNNFRYRTNL